MKAAIDRAPLLAALGRLTAIVERRQTIPILGNVSLSFEGAIARLCATDLDMEATEVLAAEVEAEGATTLPADKLFDIVKSATGGQVSFVLSEAPGRVRVSSGRSRFDVPTLSIDDFPRFPVEGLPEPWAISAKLLADMLGRVAFCRGTPTPLTALSCTHLTVADKELHAVACQRSGIALRREPAPMFAAISEVLPPKLTAHLVRWLSGVEGDALVSVAPKRLVRIEAAGSTLVSKVFDGPFVDYMRLVLEDQEASGKTAQDDLSSAVGRVMIMADSKAHSVRLGFTEGAIQLGARNQQAGEGADEIGCDYDGPEVGFLLAADDLQSALSSLSGDTVEIGFAPKIDPKVNRTGQVVIRAPVDSGMVVNLMQARA